MSKHSLTMKKRTTQTTNGNGRRASARDRQASLILAAASLFAGKGFNGTTTKELTFTVVHGVATVHNVREIRKHP